MAVLLTLVFLLVSVSAHAQSTSAKATADKPVDRNWPQFRGSRAGVAADDARLPDTWSATENVAW